MRSEEIDIHESDVDRPYRELGPVKVRVGARSAFSKSKTIEDVNVKLRKQALKMGANAVINVRYGRGVSMTSWKALTRATVEYCRIIWCMFRMP